MSNISKIIACRSLFRLQAFFGFAGNNIKTNISPGWRKSVIKFAGKKTIRNSSLAGKNHCQNGCWLVTTSVDLLLAGSEERIYFSHGS